MHSFNSVGTPQGEKDLTHLLFRCTPIQSIHAGEGYNDMITQPILGFDPPCFYRGSLAAR
jgi:hypothetical protein